MIYGMIYRVYEVLRIVLCMIFHIVVTCSAKEGRVQSVGQVPARVVANHLRSRERQGLQRLLQG